MAEEKVTTNIFEKNIFVNCPFDEDFKVLLRPLIFTIVYCVFIPRIASERLDSGENRIDKIKELIEASIYSIHDLSMVKAKKKGDYYRMNMPFEIGVDLGCRLYHNDLIYRKKRSLLLESEKYAYQKAISDLSNSDVKCHKGEPEEIVFQIRNWFSELGHHEIPIGSLIWDEFNVFYSKLAIIGDEVKLKQKDIDNMTITEMIDKMKTWVINKKLMK